jgi:hypothetical protein
LHNFNRARHRENVYNLLDMMSNISYIH